MKLASGRSSRQMVWGTRKDGDFSITKFLGCFQIIFANIKRQGSCKLEIFISQLLEMWKK
jgi:hypothetical protein